MDETTLQQILKVQTAILAELRLLRQALAPDAKPQATPTAVSEPAPQPTAPQPTAMEPPAAPQPPLTAEPLPTPEPMAAQPRVAPPQSASPMLTLNELADLGGQFLEPGHMPRTRVKPVDASDLSSSILDDIKAKNKAKRSAFAEFEKFGKDR